MESSASNIEWRCSKTVNAFYRSLDEGRFEDLLGLLHPDLVWMRGGRRILRDQVLDDLATRAADLVVVHLVCSAVFNVEADDRVSFSCYLGVLRGKARAAHNPSPPFDGMQSLHSNKGELRANGSHWQIAYLDAGQPLLAVDHSSSRL